ncbi:hypothetical protein C344_04075 [Cryptococcus neoformans AD1-7a]|nr:hypothetical protein C344_04075 [Cryptococcus neoformans var. grubii AD1-7a]
MPVSLGTRKGPPGLVLVTAQVLEGRGVARLGKMGKCLSRFRIWRLQSSRRIIKTGICSENGTLRLSTPQNLDLVIILMVETAIF